MRAFILSLPEKFQPIFIIGAILLLAFISSTLCGLFFDVHQLVMNTDLISSVYEVLGTIYAISLTFTLWGVWQNFIDANSAVQNEANTLLDLVHIVNIATDKKNKGLQDAALAYLTFVIEQEWPTLKNLTNEMINIRVRHHSASEDLVHAVKNITSENARENVIFGQTLTLLTRWLDARRIRILKARGNSVSALWPLLIIGAIVLFSFHGLFVAKTRAIWSVLLFGTALVIGVIFYLIFSLDCPFAGPFGIDSEPYYLTMNLLKKYSSDSSSTR